MIKLRQAVLISFFILCCLNSGCQPLESDSSSENGLASTQSVLHPSAVQIVQKLQQSQFTCEGHGRELYPLYYQCDRTDVSTFLYADDKGQLEGIRIFGSTSDSAEWILSSLELVTDQADRLAEHFTKDVLAQRSHQIDGLILEWEADGDKGIFRISPSSAKRN